MLAFAREQPASESETVIFHLFRSVSFHLLPQKLTRKLVGCEVRMRSEPKTSPRPVSRFRSGEPYFFAGANAAVLQPIFSCKAKIVGSEVRM